MIAVLYLDQITGIPQAELATALLREINYRAIAVGISRHRVYAVLEAPDTAPPDLGPVCVKRFDSPDAAMSWVKQDIAQSGLQPLGSVS